MSSETQRLLSAPVGLNNGDQAETLLQPDVALTSEAESQTAPAVSAAGGAAAAAGAGAGVMEEEPETEEERLQNLIEELKFYSRQVYLLIVPIFVTFVLTVWWARMIFLQINIQSNNAYVEEEEEDDEGPFGRTEMEDSLMACWEKVGDRNGGSTLHLHFAYHYCYVLLRAATCCYVLLDLAFFFFFFLLNFIEISNFFSTDTALGALCHVTYVTGGGLQRLIPTRHSFSLIFSWRPWVKDESAGNLEDFLGFSNNNNNNNVIKLRKKAIGST